MEWIALTKRGPFEKFWNRRWEKDRVVLCCGPPKRSGLIFGLGVIQMDEVMMKPLALIFYERLLPGSQLGNRLSDMGYRVQTLEEASLIPKTCRESTPIILLVDLVTNKANICELIREVRRNEDTAHLPIIAFAPQNNARIREEAVKAGATLVAIDDALLPQLPHLLEQALEVI